MRARIHYFYKDLVLTFPRASGGGSGLACGGLGVYRQVDRCVRGFILLGVCISTNLDIAEGHFNGGCFAFFSFCKYDMTYFLYIFFAR